MTSDDISSTPSETTHETTHETSQETTHETSSATRTTTASATWSDTVDCSEPLDRRILVEEHLWLADRLARRMWHRFPPHVDRSELHAAALLGLAEAASRFDPSFGVPFAAFASSRVRGEILQVARSADIVPRRLRREMRDVVEADERLAHALGRMPTVDELAGELHVDAAIVLRRRADLDRSRVKSLELEGVATAIPVDESTDPLASITDTELLGTVREAVDRLPEPLRTIVIRLHWNEDRLVDVAADMGVSFQRVAQYKLEALRTLAAWLSVIDDGVERPGEGQPGVTRRAAYCSEMTRESTWRSRFEWGSDDRRPHLTSAAG